MASTRSAGVKTSIPERGLSGEVLVRLRLHPSPRGEPLPPPGGRGASPATRSGWTPCPTSMAEATPLAPSIRS